MNFSWNAVDTKAMMTSQIKLLKVGTQNIPNNAAVKIQNQYVQMKKLWKRYCIIVPKIHQKDDEYIFHEALSFLL